jgi:hypothetical protein
VQPHAGPWHWPLVGVQLLILLAAVVLAVPGRKETR